jgi:hypothetical protein
VSKQEFEASLRAQVEAIVRARLGVMEKELVAVHNQVQQSFTHLLTQATSHLAAVGEDGAIAELATRSVAQIFAAAPPAPVLASAPVALGDLKKLILSIEKQQTQADTLNALLTGAVHYARRVALFIVKSGNIIGWAARGFDPRHENDIRGFSLSLQEDTLFRAVLEVQNTVIVAPDAQAQNAAFLRLMGDAPNHVTGIPLIVRGKAAAVLYADDFTDAPGPENVAALEILVNLAGFTVELLSARSRAALPTPTAVPVPAQFQAPAPVAPPVAPAPFVPPPVTVVPPPEPPEPTTTDAPPPVAAEEPAPVEPTPPSFQVEVEPAPVAPVAEEEPVAPPVFSFQPPPEAEPPAPTFTFQPEPVAETPAPPAAFAPEADGSPMTNHSDGYAPPIFAQPIEPPSFVVVPTPEPEEERSAPAAEPPPSFIFQPEPISQPATAFTVVEPAPKTTFDTPVSVFAPPPVAGANEEEQKAHNDARRFARLLVSEIKLYNEVKVQEGRRNNDLYDRLKEDIDRSRQMYDKRISPSVAAKFDYFYDELVNALGEGNPSKLGRDCPGPTAIV